MKFKIQLILSFAFILFSISVLSAQEKKGSAIDLIDDFNIPCESLSLVRVNFSVWSNKKGYLKDLTENDFEIYDRGEIQEIDSSIFDETKNQYIIEFYDNCLGTPHDVKIKVKLPKQRRKGYGKFSIRLQR